MPFGRCDSTCAISDLSPARASVVAPRGRSLAGSNGSFVFVNGIHPAPDIHEHFMIHKGYGTLRKSSRTTSTMLSAL